MSAAARWIEWNRSMRRRSQTRPMPMKPSSRALTMLALSLIFIAAQCTAGRAGAQPPLRAVPGGPGEDA